LALSFDNLGRYDSAVVYLLKVVQLGERLNIKTSVLKAKLNLSNTYISTNEFEKAKQLSNELINVMEAADNRNEDLALAHTIFGNSIKNLKDYQGAIAAYEKANAIYIEFNNKRGMAIILNNIGSCYFSLKEYNKVLPIYDSSMRLYKALNDKQGIMIIYGNKAVYYEKLADYNKARLYFDSTMQIANEINDADQKLLTLDNLHYFYKNSIGDPKTALHYFTAYVALKDSLFSIRKARIINDHDRRKITQNSG
jgi:tetratricopeptide (TPR) repeat protein